MRGGGGDWVPNQWTTRKGRSSARVIFIDTWHFSGHVRLNPCLKPGNVFSSFFKDFGNLQKLRWDILCILMMHSIGSHCLSVWLQQRTLEWRLTLNRQNLLLHWRCDFRVVVVEIHKYLPAYQAPNGATSRGRVWTVAEFKAKQRRLLAIRCPPRGTSSPPYSERFLRLSWRIGWTLDGWCKVISIKHGHRVPCFTSFESVQFSV